MLAEGAAVSMPGNFRMGSMFGLEDVMDEETTFMGLDDPLFLRAFDLMDWTGAGGMPRSAGSFW